MVSPAWRKRHLELMKYYIFGPSGWRELSSRGIGVGVSLLAPIKFVAQYL